LTNLNNIFNQRIRKIVLSILIDVYVDILTYQ